MTRDMEVGDANWKRMWDAAEQMADDIRRETFAEVSRAMNRVADIWEKDGSDPCRVHITREYANAYRLYAEGYGEPTGSAKETARRRYDQCDQTCTADCGHCKGLPLPEVTP